MEKQVAPAEGMSKEAAPNETGISETGGIDNRVLHSDKGENPLTRSEEAIPVVATSSSVASVPHGGVRSAKPMAPALHDPPHADGKGKELNATFLSVSDKANSPAPRIGSKGLETPHVFKGKKLRSGKWLPEEEAYSKILIEMFEAGHFADLENGITLRMFLSRKLHCAPMRISKKFAGKGIGKNIYRRQLSSPYLNADEARLRVAEMEFFKALGPKGMRQNCLPKGYPVSPMGTLQHPFPQVYFPFVLSPYPGNQQHRSGSAASPLQVLPQAPVLPNGRSAAPDGTLMPVLAASVSTLPKVFQSTGSNSLVVPAKEPITSVKRLQQSYQTALQQKGISTPAVPGAVLHPASLAPGALVAQPQMTLGSRTLPSSQGSASVQPMPSGSVPELPDFLSGFDKVIGHSTFAPEAKGLQYSPPFTSQSFDDIHLFLGKEALTLNETSGNTDPPVSASDGCTSVADSYYQFAQESANMASQHSAYSSTKASSSPDVGVFISEQSNTNIEDADAVLKSVADSMAPHGQAVRSSEDDLGLSNWINRGDRTPPAVVSGSEHWMSDVASSREIYLGEDSASSDSCSDYAPASKKMRMAGEAVQPC